MNSQRHVHVYISSQLRLHWHKLIQSPTTYPWSTEKKNGETLHLNSVRRETTRVSYGNRRELGLDWENLEVAFFEDFSAPDDLMSLGIEFEWFIMKPAQNAQKSGSWSFHTKNVKQLLNPELWLQIHHQGARLYLVARRSMLRSGFTFAVSNR